MIFPLIMDREMDWINTEYKIERLAFICLTLLC